MVNEKAGKMSSGRMIEYCLISLAIGVSIAFANYAGMILVNFYSSYKSIIEATPLPVYIVKSILNAYVLTFIVPIVPSMMTGLFCFIFTVVPKL